MVGARAGATGPTGAGGSTRTIPRPLELRTPVGEVGAERVSCTPSEWHHPLLVALAEHPREPVVEVEVVEVEPDQLADPDTARVERLEDRPVAERTRAVADHGTEQRLDVGFAQRLGDALRHTRGAHVLTRVAPDQALFEAEAMEGVHRSDGPGDRRGGETRAAVVAPRIAELVDVPGDRLFVDRVRIRHAVTSQVIGVAPEIAPVRGERVRCQAALDPQPGVVLVEQHVEAVGHLSAPTRPAGTRARRRARRSSSRR